MFFFDFSKNSTIEKTDINSVKSSTNQKIATNACINSANFAFSAIMHLQISSNFSMFFVNNHHLKKKLPPPPPCPKTFTFFHVFCWF